MVVQMNDIPERSLRGKVSEVEWEARVELACAYRMAYHYGWYSQIFNHISYKIPGTDGEFLLNPLGFFYDEITASNLVKVDLEGNTLDGSPHGVIQAGWIIHSAIHAARSDVRCIVHTHSDDGVAVSAQKWGLLPVNMTAIMFHNRVAYHDYEGPSIETDERERLAANMGKDKYAMILRNHGLITCGESVPEAMYRHHQFERSCTAQVRALSGGYENLQLPSAEVIEEANRRSNRKRDYTPNWQAHVRMVDRMYPGYDV